VPGSSVTPPVVSVVEVAIGGSIGAAVSVGTSVAGKAVSVGTGVLVAPGGGVCVSVGVSVSVGVLVGVSVGAVVGVFVGVSVGVGVRVTAPALALPGMSPSANALAITRVTNANFRQWCRAQRTIVSVLSRV
jgi:hypothetical protein